MDDKITRMSIYQDKDDIHIKEPQKPELSFSLSCLGYCIGVHFRGASSWNTNDIYMKNVARIAWKMG